MPLGSPSQKAAIPTRASHLIRTLLPVALAGLVALLAALQYRWLGQVSAIERQEMRASLARRAEDLAGEFNREVSRLYRALSAPGGVDNDVAGEALSALRRWRGEAQFPGMVKALYLTSASSNADTVQQIALDTGTMTTLPVPDSIRLALRPHEPFHIGDGPDSPDSRMTRFVSIVGPPFVSKVPALVIWLPSRVPFHLPAPDRVGPSSVDLMVGPVPDTRALIVELDRAYLSDAVLAVLVDRHFGLAHNRAEPARESVETSGQTRVYIADADNQSVLSRGLRRGESISSAQADVAVPLFVPDAESGGTPGLRVVQWTAADHVGRIDNDLAVRIERRVLTSEGRDQSADQRFDTVPLESWSLRIQHGAGSLDAAVAIGRARNLAMGFGILAVLAAAMALVLVNARRAERLAAQQIHFVAAVSHELRTPLAVIRSAAENISAGIVRDPEQAERYGRLIEAEGRRLTSTIEQVLAYAGIGASPKQVLRAKVIDTEAVVRQAISATASLAGKAGCRIDLDVEADMPPAFADEAALQSTLENLIVNALKHGSDGGVVKVRAARASDSTDAIELSVEDRGLGIEPRDRPHIFEPFYRGQRAIEAQVPGSGLGLSVVKSSIEGLGGNVSVAPVPGGGSKFTLRLPATRQRETSIEADA